MGCVTAQLEDSSQPPSGTAAAGASVPSPNQMVLLTLVVRADQRQQGLGRVLLKVRHLVTQLHTHVTQLHTRMTQLHVRATQHLLQDVVPHPSHQQSIPTLRHPRTCAPAAGPARPGTERRPGQHCDRRGGQQPAGCPLLRVGWVQANPSQRRDAGAGPEPWVALASGQGRVTSNLKNVQWCFVATTKPRYVRSHNTSWS